MSEPKKTRTSKYRKYAISSDEFRKQILNESQKDMLNSIKTIPSVTVENKPLEVVADEKPLKSETVSEATLAKTKPEKVIDEKQEIAETISDIILGNELPKVETDENPLKSETVSNVVLEQAEPKNVDDEKKDISETISNIVWEDNQPEITVNEEKETPGIGAKPITVDDISNNEESVASVLEDDTAKEIEKHIYDVDDDELEPTSNLDDTKTTQILCDVLKEIPNDAESILSPEETAKLEESLDLVESTDSLNQSLGDDLNKVSENELGTASDVEQIINQALQEDAPTDSLKLSDAQKVAELVDGTDGNGKKKKKKKKDKVKHKWTYYAGITICSLVNVCAIACFFIVYGPFNYVRDLYITTAMRTMTHKYLANVFYSTETIQEVLANNVLIEPDEVMDAAAITIGNIKQPDTYANAYEEQVLKRDEGNDLYKVVTLNENGYKGWVVFVYDPTKISLAVTRYLGNVGEYVTTMAKLNNAAVAINGGGFLDAGGYGTGGYPTGFVIKDGKVVWSRYRGSSWGGGTIGFTKEGLLLLTKNVGQSAVNEGVWNGVDFGPFLILNGQSAEVSGNGGWGVQPRTCIGQRRDGIVVFLVVDGRTTSSLGIDLNVAIEIMNRYGVYNAANLDGGASSVLAIDGKLINHPVGWDYTGERGVPTAWIVKE